MKIINRKKLREYGFITLKEYKSENYINEDDPLYYISDSSYIYTIGHSRRGQFYYYVAAGNQLFIYASKPDGDGASCILDDLIIRLYIDGVIEI